MSTRQEAALAALRQRGAPVPAEEVGAMIGVSTHTAVELLRDLVDTQHVRVRRSPPGYTYEVAA